MPFDIGESYGGVLPVGRGINGTYSAGNTTEQQLYFWFFPSESPEATDEILIWLNGGVSCLSISCNPRISLLAFADHRGCDDSSILGWMLTDLALAGLFQSHRSGGKWTLCMEGRYLAASRKPLVMESLDKPSLCVVSPVTILNGD